jgi:hypothetical protein
MAGHLEGRRMNKFVCAISLAAAAIVGPAATVSQPTVFAQSAGAWTNLFDGTSMSQWKSIGEAEWHIIDGAIQPDAGKSGFLVSMESYGDFELRAEFWVSPDANSGIFVRCEDSTQVTAMNAYEVNIFDTRPDQTYRTGGIVDVAKPMSVVTTGNRWNIYEISAKGSRLVVRLNGLPMVDVQDTKHARGPIALQAGAGTVRFRRIQIR